MADLTRQTNVGSILLSVLKSYTVELTFRSEVCLRVLLRGGSGGGGGESGEALTTAA